MFEHVINYRTYHIKLTSYVTAYIKFMMYLFFLLFQDNLVYFSIFLFSHSSEKTDNIPVFQVSVRISKSIELETWA